MAGSIETDESQNLVQATSTSLFRFKNQVQNTVRNAFPELATDDNVPKIGRARNTPKLPGEIDGEYRNRVRNAFEGNQGRGNLNDIILVMNSLGFTPFSSTTSGDTSQGQKSFNIVLSFAGGAVYDSTFDYDGTIKYSSPRPNEITIEIVQVTITQAIDDAIRQGLRPILRASMSIFDIVEI